MRGDGFKSVNFLPLKTVMNPLSINIPVKEKNYLGVLITKDQKERCNLNYQCLIDKTEKDLSSGYTDLSVRGHKSRRPFEDYLCLSL